MKARVLILFLFLIAGFKIQAQDDARKLTLPSSPAFSILGYEPTAVMKPTSNKDLAADVLNSFDKDGKLLMNLGLEVTPYWMQSRPTLTRQQYLNPNPGQAILQSLSISAATVKDSASGDNKFGAGFRFKVLNGRPVKDLEPAERKLTDIQTIQSDIGIVRTAIITGEVTTLEGALNMITATMKSQLYPQETIAQVEAEAQQVARNNNYSNSPADLQRFVEALNSTIDSSKSKQEALQKVVTLTKQRTGFILEFAGATAYNITNSNELERIGFWANLSNYVSATDLFTLTARYTYQNMDTSVNNMDVGLSYMKKGEKYNVSVEYMLRWYQGEIPDINQSGESIIRLDKDFSYRLAVQGSYLLSNQLSINLSLGKNFDDPFLKTSGFFSMLGINYSIFNYEKVKL